MQWGHTVSKIVKNLTASIANLAQIVKMHETQGEIARVITNYPKYYNLTDLQ